MRGKKCGLDDVCFDPSHSLIFVIRLSYYFISRPEKVLRSVIICMYIPGFNKSFVDPQFIGLPGCIRAQSPRLDTA